MQIFQIADFEDATWRHSRCIFMLTDCYITNFLIFRYTQTAAPFKDVVILLDLSGNKEQSAVEIAKDTAKKIIETLCDDDSLNVIQVTMSSISQYLLCVLVTYFLNVMYVVWNAEGQK